METFLVGGAVRDALLGLKSIERDWMVVGATPEDMLAQGFRQVGKGFPVFIHPKSGEEYALARTERKAGLGHTGFDCYSRPDVTLEEDLLRRDLSINAIAQAQDGTLIDPYGGQQDLANRTLRHVSPAFAEDPLRVLRVARFTARFHHLGFSVAPETLVLMQQMTAAGELEHLVPERVWKELSRALGEQSPEVFVEVLRACGALAVVLPELDNLFGVPQPERYHPEIDTGIHTLMALQQAVQRTADTRVRFAALTHDLGKAATPKDKWPSHRGHEDKGAELLLGLAKRLKIPNDYTQLARLTTQYHTQCHRALELKPSTVLKLLERVDAFRKPERFRQFILACEADAHGRTGLEDKPYPQADLLRRAFKASLRISPDNLVKKGFHGAELGEALRQQRIAAIAEINRGNNLNDADSGSANE